MPLLDLLHYTLGPPFVYGTMDRCKVVALNVNVLHSFLLL